MPRKELASLSKDPCQLFYNFIGRSDQASAQWGSVTHQMAVPVPSISCCVLNNNNLFYQIHNALAFNWDTCCRLVHCLRLLPFHSISCLWWQCWGAMQLTIRGSTVVERSTHNPKIQGLTPASGTWGLFYKNIMILNDASRVISGWCHNLEDHLWASITLIESLIMLLELSIMLLELSIMLLELSIMLLEYQLCSQSCQLCSQSCQLCS